MRIVVTVDTEADGQWEHGRPLATANVAAWPPFQELCRRQGVRPRAGLPEDQFLQGREEHQVQFPRAGDGLVGPARESLLEPLPGAALFAKGYVEGPRVVIYPHQPDGGVRAGQKEPGLRGLA